MERNAEIKVRRYASGMLARSVTHGVWKDKASEEAAAELARRLEGEARDLERPARPEGPRRDEEAAAR